MIILRLFQSSFLSFTKTVRADCFLGVRFEVTSVFDYDIVFGERERECCKLKSRFRIRVLGKIMLWIHLSLVGVLVTMKFDYYYVQ